MALKKLSLNLFFSFLFFIFLFPPYVKGQAFVNLKVLNIKRSDAFSVGDVERGKIWTNKEKKEVLLYSGDGLIRYSLREDVFMPLGELAFEGEAFTVKKWQIEDDDKKKRQEKIEKFAPKFLWRSQLRSGVITMATTDVNGERLFLIDKDGDILVFNLADKDYEGKLNFLKKSIRFFKPLKNGGLLIVYEDGTIYYVEHFKVPVFSFLQNLENSFRVKKTITVPISFMSALSLSPNEESFVIAADHKRLFLFELPTLSYRIVAEEKLFVEYVDYIDNDLLIYMTLAVRELGDTPITIRNHFKVLEDFFDLRRTAVASPQGNRFLRITENESLTFFDVTEPQMLGSIGIEQKKIGDIYWGCDNKTVIITDKKRTGFALYQLKKVKD